MMGQWSKVLVLLLFIQFSVIAAVTNGLDSAALQSLTANWMNTPSNWVGSDPCGGLWVGIECNNSRVTAIMLSNINVTGQLSGDIGSFSELQTLDLSFNTNLTGTLPQEIGNLKKLQTLSLMGCGFTGPIPSTIGSLQQLISLSLNSNKFTGQIPNSIGTLSNLYYLDLTGNQLEGSIPVSDGNGTKSGLDMLLHTRHFHLGNNKLSGTIPPKLFNPNMTLIHVNNLTGSIPSTLGLVQTLQMVRFDRNSLNGLPSNLNSLTNVIELSLSNNNLSGPMANLTGMNSLSYLDMSNNSFTVSDVPPWIASLPLLTTLMMENTQLQGQVPVDLFSLPDLQKVVLRNNRFNGTLDISTTNSNQLQLIDLRNNSISNVAQIPGGNITLLLEGNTVCDKTDQVTKSYCPASTPNSSYFPPPHNCMQISCNSDQVASPNCECAYPYKGILVFRGLASFDLGNTTYYARLEKSLMETLQSFALPVDSVSLSNPIVNSYGNIELSLEVFPSGQECFNQTAITMVGFALNNLSFYPPPSFGPFYLMAFTYVNCAAALNKSSGIIIGVAVGGSVLLLLVVLAVVYAFHQKKIAKRASEQNNPFAHWDQNMGNGSAPQLQAAKRFSFEELKKYTNNFSEANSIGSGGYGKVYRGTLPTGQLIAIKRAQSDSMQGGLEFKTEIELLSRVHHKNLVSLLGFCFEQGEQMLVYEYIPNGTLMGSVSGKSGIRLDWMGRLKVTLGAARGLVYLHEHANPPIIHRDIKSNNILLDESFNAKVADFGLSKSEFDSERNSVTTQVKGTLGYLDPEYYMTQQLTKKSDVYSFGVVMLELITARKPIQQGKYIVVEVRNAINKSKDLYNLHEILDPFIGLGKNLEGLEEFVDLAMRCVADSGDRRPTMDEVVKEIENIMKLSGMNPSADSEPTTVNYYEASKSSSHHSSSNDVFGYSGSFPSSSIELM
ncbi:probable leucine-rich repeat receptor-like protein kinase At5g49770 isoform X2 [Quercus lobata]|uniref:probable leucine-rich repeat receptor-like protein kinase At5g49770 isoform X2 n=1 Tax=Quercus lobata TaxID=97700 RepID=UPI0012494179|nr:probable leucine-rich repeat receptor-like protein kinase At5g49770 isoform X2 [Quercus lobata]